MSLENVKVKRIKRITDLPDYWELFLRGLAKMNTLVKDSRKVSDDTFFRVLSDTLASGTKRGHVAVYFDGDRQIGYSVAFDNTVKYLLPSVLIYAAYSEAKFKGLTSFAWKHIEGWARSGGYKEVQAFSPRFSGAGFYLFEKCFGFQRQAVFFTKAI